jgi:predicted dehydrogenase
MSKLRLGIVGCGGMGSRHARVLGETPDAELTVFCDPDEERAASLQAELGGRTAADSAQVIAADDVDAVVISTHHDLHCPFCLAAARAGKHIFVEKPLALTVEECLQVEAAVAQAGVVLMVGFQARFSPFVQRLTEAIPHPLLTVGQIVDPRWGDGLWANDPLEGGGNVLSQGCHTFDLVSWLNGGEPEHLVAVGDNVHHPGLDITDCVAASIRFASGGLASVIVGDVGRPSLVGKEFIELFDGQKTGTLTGYYETPRLDFWGLEPERVLVEDLPEPERDFYVTHGYVQQMQGFVQWALTGERPGPAATAREGTIATALAAWSIQAAREKRVVDFSLPG